MGLTKSRGTLSIYKNIKERIKTYGFNDDRDQQNVLFSIEIEDTL